MCRTLYDMFDPRKFEGTRRVYLASERTGSFKEFTFRLATKSKRDFKKCILLVS